MISKPPLTNRQTLPGALGTTFSVSGLFELAPVAGRLATMFWKRQPKTDNPAAVSRCSFCKKLQEDAQAGR